MADNEELSFKEKLAFIQFKGKGPAKLSKTPPNPGNNSWERGIVTDNRGMPYLDENLEPIRSKKWAQNRRKYEESLRRLRNND